jgi:hypothetical protein
MPNFLFGTFCNAMCNKETWSSTRSMVKASEKEEIEQDGP